MKLEQEREKFLLVSIPFICKKGWKDEALSDASIKAFKDELYYKTLFNSTKDIVEYFEAFENTQMVKKFGKKKKDDSIRGFIGKLVLYRIKEISGGADMHKALTSYYMKHPDMATKSIWNIADIIWKSAGDNSTDMNYYSKRFLLSSIYTLSLRSYAKKPDDIDSYVEESLDKLIKRMQNLKMPKMEDIPILRLFC